MSGMYALPLCVPINCAYEKELDLVWACPRYVHAASVRRVYSIFMSTMIWFIWLGYAPKRLKISKKQYCGTSRKTFICWPRRTCKKLSQVSRLFRNKQRGFKNQSWAEQGAGAEKPLLIRINVVSHRRTLNNLFAFFLQQVPRRRFASYNLGEKLPEWEGEMCIFRKRTVHPKQPWYFLPFANGKSVEVSWSQMFLELPSKTASNHQKQT